MNDKGVTQSGRKSRRDVEPERGARGEGMEMEMGWGEAGTTPPPSPPPSPNPQPATQDTHSCCGLSWAKEGSRGVLNLTNLYETNTIRTHTQTHTLAHTLSPRL